jgi:hypothetical protein
MVVTLRRILKNGKYGAFFLGTLGATFLAIALFPNLTLLISVLGAEVAFATKLMVLLSLIAAMPAGFTPVTLAIATVFALLLSLNLTLLTYYIRRRRKGLGRTGRISAASLGGVVSGVLGIGCAACGSIVLSVIVTTFGGAGLLALLPYGGSELAFLGLGMLIVSSVILVSHINDPLVCRIDN